MKFNQLICAFAVVSLLLGCATSCSSSEEPSAERQTHAEEADSHELSLIGKLVNGEMNGAVIGSKVLEYERELGKSQWREINIFGDDETGDFIAGHLMGADFPHTIIFRDSECLLDFINSILNYPPRFGLLDAYWGVYCEKTARPYGIYIRVPYEYRPQENYLQLGYVNYTVESCDSEEFQLGYYSSDSFKEYNSLCTFAPDASQALDQDSMLVYDSYEQMHDDIVHRLKEAFGEEGDISALWPAHPNIKFEELEKEMAEMAYECPYWFAPKPAWH